MKKNRLTEALEKITYDALIKKSEAIFAFAPIEPHDLVKYLEFHGGYDFQVFEDLSNKENYDFALLGTIKVFPEIRNQLKITVHCDVVFWIKQGDAPTWSLADAYILAVEHPHDPNDRISLDDLNILFEDFLKREKNSNSTTDDSKEERN